MKNHPLTHSAPSTIPEKIRRPTDARARRDRATRRRVRDARRWTRARAMSSSRTRARARASDARETGASPRCDACAGGRVATWYCAQDEVRTMDAMRRGATAYLCDECDASVHSANGIASKHERRAVGGHVALGDADSRRPSGEYRGGEYAQAGEVTTDDVIGICEEYLDSSLMSSFPVETLDGAFWDETLGPLDDVKLDPESFLRDVPFEDDNAGDVEQDDDPGMSVEKPTLRKSKVQDSAGESREVSGSDERVSTENVSLSGGELERLKRLGRGEFDTSFLGPILDDSAMKFLEFNPSYGEFGSPSPESSVGMSALSARFGTTQVKQELVDGATSNDWKSEAPSSSLSLPATLTNAKFPATGFFTPDGVASGSETYAGLPQPQTRLERLKRWKEKRKNRNFNKVIRYQSRKASADTRPRIKGKFVRLSSVPDLSRIKEEADSDKEDDKDEPRDLIKELGLDAGLRAPPSMRAMKKGLVTSASMPDFSVYNMDD